MQMLANFLSLSSKFIAFFSAYFKLDLPTNVIHYFNIVTRVVSCAHSGLSIIFYCSHSSHQAML